MDFAYQVEGDVIGIEISFILKFLWEGFIDRTDFEVAAIGTAVPGEEIGRKDFHPVFEIRAVQYVLSQCRGINKVSTFTLWRNDIIVWLEKLIKSFGGRSGIVASGRIGDVGRGRETKLLRCLVRYNRWCLV